MKLLSSVTHYSIVKEHYHANFHALPSASHLHGGGERARTDDLLRAKQVLSQLSYTPMSLSY